MSFSSQFIGELMKFDRNKVLYITTADGTTLGVLGEYEITISAETISSRETVRDADGALKTKVSNRIEEPPVITITGKMVDWDASVHVKIV